VFGLLFVLGGGLFLVLAVVHFSQTWNLAHRQPTVVTAAELCRKDYAKSAPDWIEHTFAESKPSKNTVTRSQLGNSVQVQANCLLVRVQNSWLAATVGQEFEGNQLVGRLVPLQPSLFQALSEELGDRKSRSFHLLPYEFDAVGTSAREQRIAYIASASIAGFGLLGLWLGLYLYRRGLVAVTASAHMSCR
jgi:hypothetical protein